MLYLYIIIMSVLVGLLRKGNLNALTHISIKKMELIILAALIQAGLIFLGGKKIPLVLRFSAYPMIFSYILLLYVAWYNQALKGINLIALGIGLNFFVILANNGQMPVLLTSLHRAGLHDFVQNLKEGTYVTHVLISDKTLFRFLADVIPLSRPFPDSSVVSVGDFLMFYGVFNLIQNAMLVKKDS